MMEMAGDIFTVSDNGDCVINIGRYCWLEKWLNPIKEVKRPAKLGEFIKIVESDGHYQNEYENGDILKALGGNGYGTIYNVEKQLHCMCSEYVALEGYEECDRVKNIAHDDKIGVGNIVTVKYPEKCYTTYVDFFKANCPELGFRYQYGVSLSDGNHDVESKFKVLYMNRHESKRNMPCVIEHICSEKLYLIDVEGLEKVRK